MELLAETAGVDAAPALAQRIHQGGDRLLEKMGPEAADAVLPYMNSSDATVRNSVRQMLAKWEIDENSLIRHCLAPVDDKLKKEIAIRVETLLIDGGPVFVSLLDKFSRGEETEKVIVAGLKANPSNIAILNVVAEMDSESSVEKRLSVGGQKNGGASRRRASPFAIPSHLCDQALQRRDGDSV